MFIRCLAVALAVLVSFAGPAAAHPFGPPSTAQVAADGSTLTLSWLAAEDDWVALGQSLGAFNDPSQSLTGEQKLQQSPAVRDYLLKRITVRQQGQPCTGRLQPLEALLTTGARFEFDCPAPVVDVEITLSALTDLNEAYRTVLTAGSASPQQALFTAAESTQHVRFTGGSGVNGSVITVAIGTGLAVLLGVGFFLVRRRRRTA